MVSQIYEYHDIYRDLPERSSFFNIFNRQISSTLKCFICKDVLIEPTQTECGCRFCHRCIEDHVNQGNTMCPNCDSSVSKDKFLRDKAIEKEIFQLEIKCLNDGCNHICVLRELRNHLIVCEYRKELCENCGQSYSYNTKDNHLLDNCPRIIVQCNDCGSQMTREDMHNIHTNIQLLSDKLCHKLKGKCPYECNGDNIHDNLRMHSINCSHKPMDCIFIELGCDYVTSKDNIAKHLQNDSINHQILLMNEIIRLKNENDILTKSIQSRNLETNQEILNIKQMNAELVSNVENLRKCEKETTKTIQDMKSQIDRYKQINNEPLINNDLIISNGEYNWMIGNIRQKCIDAKSTNQTQIISEPFYTSTPGYKMCLKIYPNGDAQAMNNYLSIYFVIVKGEYDDELSWPFKHKVTLTIASSNSLLPNITVIMKPDNNESCYGKPISHYNVGAGQPKFINLSQLLNTNNYIHDGSLKIIFKLNLNQ